MLQKLLVLLCLTLLFAGSVGAGDNQAQRIKALERDNYRQAMEISRLRAQLQEERRRSTQSRRPWSSYGYGSSPMSSAARQMREAEQMKRSWENLTR